MRVVNRWRLASASILAMAGCSGGDGRDAGFRFDAGSAMDAATMRDAAAAMDARPAMDARADDATPSVDASASDVVERDVLSDACATVIVDTHRATPNVLVVIDRSGSMLQPYEGGGTRWESLRTALTSMPDGLAYQLRDTVRFGTLMYSEDIEVPGCPDVAVSVAALDGYEGIERQFMRNSPGGNTPTGEAIMATLDRIATLAPGTDPTHLVLATDGEPATCADGTDIGAGRALVIDQVGAAYSRGIRTYVLSVGTEIANVHLQDVANAGVGRAPDEPNAPYWIADDYATLRDALAEIVGGVISCELELDGSIDPALACEGTVTIDGEPLDCGTAWRAIDSSHIELLGDACARVRDVTMDEIVVAAFPCDVFI